MTKGEETMVNSHRPSLAPARPLAYQILRTSQRSRCHGFRIARTALRNRRAWDRRNAAYGRCAGRQRRCRDKFAIPLPRRRTIRICGGVTCHTSTSKGVAVGVRRRETIGECFQEGNDLVLLRIRQAEHTRRRVEIVRDLFHRPAGHPLNRSFRAVPRSDWLGKAGVARIVEMYKLLQALDVAVMKELFLEVRFPRAGFGGGTLRRRHRHIASRGHLELAVNHWCKLYPRPVRVGAGTKTASEESSHSQISVAETERIPNEPEGIRRGLIIESIPGIQRQTRSEEHTSELQSPDHLVCRLLLEKKKIKTQQHN